ncbi:competence type IV pilus ATPase ComGA [Vaginisenegalia massiliensis]|uniref:competence type IV pilus ATPase ComGA n=1 Tax=Vaginisenegalia massiliensis TaxID=2058294 RepID=UPI001F14CA54|nr:competence type IV pilus ATPase ComGA [Vaginisenegalia massiliensis]
MNKLITLGLQKGVSDIHFIPGQQVYRIYFRINGQLELHQSIEVSAAQQVINYLKFKADMDVGEKRKPQSGVCHLSLPQGMIELRLSTICSFKLLESLVIRLIAQVEKDLGQLHAMFPRDVEALNQLIRRKSGLLIFSGPVGSGKTTSIYQLLRQRIQEGPLQVITMEDPVEIVESNFLQTQINEQSGICYDLLIKSALRHHPDVMVIGEIRDEESARMTIRAALTGHLMVATIHAKDAFGVLARLEELRVTREQMKQTLIGIVSQRLVPYFCPFCQGPCLSRCHWLPISHKRAAIWELLEGENLKKAMANQPISHQFHSLNHKLLKAWVEGYIDDKTYYHFEVV